MSSSSPASSSPIPSAAGSTTVPDDGGSRTVPRLDRPGLLVMDVDSTLIDEEVIDQLGLAAGVGEGIAAITRRAMEGGMDFRQALRERVALLRGLPVTVFDEVRASVHFTNGALDLITELHGRGWKVGAVSGGFHEIVDDLAADAHLDHWLANRLEAAGGRLTGRVLGDIVTKDVKLDAVRRWADEDGIPMEQTVAVGDGANDIPMIGAAGLGIAFCAKRAVREAARHSIDERDLRRVLDFLH